MFGNSSGERSSIAFGEVFACPRARLYAFFVYESADRRTFGEDLALLSSLVASGELKPQIEAEASWRELASTLSALRDRRINGKAILRIE